MSRPIEVALAGNPNTGKTSLFNLLTGANQSVGNWAGVTVERREGLCQGAGTLWQLVDLPGIYALGGYSMEEQVARDYLLAGEAGLILNILDAAHLERNLYLTLQLLELGRPMVVALNMMDELAAAGSELEITALSRRLGVEVVPISARTGKGREALLAAMERTAARGEAPARLPFPPVVEALAGELAGGIGSIREGLEQLEGELPSPWRQKREEAARVCGTVDGESLLPTLRYGQIEELLAGCLHTAPSGRAANLTDAIDRIALGRYTALPLWLAVLGVMFWVTFSQPGNWLRRGMEWFSGEFLSNAVWVLLWRWDLPQWAYGLVQNGILGGVGAVLSFLPQLLLLFLFLALLEDSGYMARAAFLADGILSRFGLTGRSFIPMLMGFGCTATAVPAARTTQSGWERTRTVLLVPFFSCSAKLPVYLLFTAAFFPQLGAWPVAGLYGLGVLLAAGTARLTLRFTGPRESPPFLLEFPPYRLPTAKNLLLHLWERCGGFLAKTGSLIFVMSVGVWLLQSITPSLTWAQSGAQSIFGQVGIWLAPLLRPLGFGFWQAAVALLAGLAAKEAVVSTLMVLCGAGSQGKLSLLLPTLFTPASACSFLVFCLLYSPCIAACAAIRRESGRGAALFSFCFQTGIAYAMAWLVYHLALLVGLG